MYLKDRGKIDILRLLGPKPPYAYIVLPHTVRATGDATSPINNFIPTFRTQRLKQQLHKHKVLVGF